jgi:hypothetical protein
MKSILIPTASILGLAAFITGCQSTPPVSEEPVTHKHTHVMHHWEIASADPDRIFLTFYGNPAHSRAVTWRTDTSITNACAEIAVALGEPGFDQLAKRSSASSETVDLSLSHNSVDERVQYHSVIFDELQPNTLYAYRVGDGNKNWSEWIQFHTASVEAKPFEFVYFGDAQNDVHSRWSRVIRMAHQLAPEARFALHAGDLINAANADNEWAGWFKAGSFLHAQWTGIPVVGNHEYRKGQLSMLWMPQFTLPQEDSLPQELQETVYTVEYQDTQIIILNSLIKLDEQTVYLEEQLKKPGFNWRIITLHYPIFGPSDRGKLTVPPEVRKQWIALIEKYNVDLVLQGHDHSYVRGQVPMIQTTTVQGAEAKTVYITSVSGPKQYAPDKVHLAAYEAENFSASRMAANTQFFQVIGIDENKLSYRAHTATGELYDAFTLDKDFSSGEKRITEQIPETDERTFENTSDYSKENLK